MPRKRQTFWLSGSQTSLFWVDDDFWLRSQLMAAPTSGNDGVCCGTSGNGGGCILEMATRLRVHSRAAQTSESGTHTLMVDLLDDPEGSNEQSPPKHFSYFFSINSNSEPNAPLARSRRCSRSRGVWWYWLGFGKYRRRYRRSRWRADGRSGYRNRGERTVNDHIDRDDDCDGDRNPNCDLDGHVDDNGDEYLNSN